MKATTGLRKLCDLAPGEKAVISAFKQDSAFSLRMMELGVTPGSAIEMAYTAPFGGTIAIQCRGSLIGLRIEDAQTIEVLSL